MRAQPPMSPPALSLPWPPALSLGRLHCCLRSLPLPPLAALARPCLPPASALPGGWTSWQPPAHSARTAVLGLPPPSSYPPPPPNPPTPRKCRRLPPTPPLPPPHIHARSHIRDVERVRPWPFRRPLPLLLPLPLSPCRHPLCPVPPRLCLSLSPPSPFLVTAPSPLCRPVAPGPSLPTVSRLSGDEGDDTSADVAEDACEGGCGAAPGCMRAISALTAGGRWASSQACGTLRCTHGIAPELCALSPLPPQPTPFTPSVRAPYMCCALGTPRILFPVHSPAFCGLCLVAVGLVLLCTVLVCVPAPPASLLLSARVSWYPPLLPARQSPCSCLLCFPLVTSPRSAPPWPASCSAL